MKIVCQRMKATPSMVAPTTIPRKMVTMLTSAPPDVLASRSVTVDSRSKLPNISMPMRGAHPGTASDATTAVTIGKRMTAVFDTALVCGMSMARSPLVVSRRMIGG